MIKVPRSQSTSVKHMIYPEGKKTDKKFHNKNLTELKKQQVEMKKKKEEKENYKPPEPYKMKEFKHVEAKFNKLQQDKRPEFNENYLTNEPRSNRKLKNHSVSRLPKIDSRENRRTLQNINPMKKPGTMKEGNVFSLANNDNEDELKKMIEEHNQKYINPNAQTKEGEVRHKQILKGPTPKANEINMLEPKEKRNYIEQNKSKIIKNEIPLKTKKKEEKEDNLHRNFGKTPEYLQKYRHEAEMKIEVERKIAEESKFPAGTRLLSDEERLETLHNLNESKKEIMNLLEKMPISMRTMAIQNRKMELEKKLSEIEDAIKMFSRKQVFIKNDE